MLSREGVAPSLERGLGLEPWCSEPGCETGVWALPMREGVWKGEVSAARGDSGVAQLKPNE